MIIDGTLAYDMEVKYEMADVVRGRAGLGLKRAIDSLFLDADVIYHNEDKISLRHDMITIERLVDENGITAWITFRDAVIVKIFPEYFRIDSGGYGEVAYKMLHAWLRCDVYGLYKYQSRWWVARTDKHNGYLYNISDNARLETVCTMRDGLCLDYSGSKLQSKEYEYRENVRRAKSIAVSKQAHEGTITCDCGTKLPAAPVTACPQCCTILTAQ